MGNVIFIGQLVLIAIQLIIIGILTYKEVNGYLTDEQEKDYKIASWSCCGGVWLLFFIHLIFV